MSRKKQNGYHYDVITDYDKSNTDAQYKHEHNMYRLIPAPPKLDYDEYIRNYITERDEKYLAWFLHYYESSANHRATVTADTYGMPEHFADIKGAVVTGIVKALTDYAIDSGTPFLAFAESYIDSEIENYIRTSQSSVITLTKDTYPVLKKVMAIYNANADKTVSERISLICEKTGLTEKTVQKYISIGRLNMSRMPFFGTYNSDDEDEDKPEDPTRDDSSNPERLFFLSAAYNAVRCAWDTLTLREQYILSAHLGFCVDCFNVKKVAKGKADLVLRKKQAFQDIAYTHQLSSAEAAEKIYYKALEKMRRIVTEELKGILF